MAGGQLGTQDSTSLFERTHGEGLRCEGLEGAASADLPMQRLACRLGTEILLAAAEPILHRGVRKRHRGALHGAQRSDAMLLRPL